MTTKLRLLDGEPERINYGVVISCDYRIVMNDGATITNRPKLKDAITECDRLVTLSGQLLYVVDSKNKRVHDGQNAANTTPTGTN